MGAFVVLYHHSGATPDDHAIFEKAMAGLAHRGPDGSGMFFSGQTLLGHWHFWTTPEDAGESQPLSLPGLPFYLVLDGRVDNRDDLCASLGIAPLDAPSFSDARLVLLSYARWGADCVKRLLGEFAFALWDEQRQELFCARDPLGDRTLYYAQAGSRVILASEPWAIVSALGSQKLNEQAVAHYFVFRPMLDGQTLFDTVFELLPAHAMQFDSSGKRAWRYWSPDPKPVLRYRTDAEYAEHLLDLLEKSVRCRLRASYPLAAQMSGGMDSPSVAVLAARALAPNSLTTISYIFDELKACDEREYINAVRDKWQLNSCQLVCDEDYPYRDFSKGPSNLNWPEASIYRELKERVYQNLQDQGVRSVLTGGFGDGLYCAEDHWLVDLFADGQLSLAFRELFFHLRRDGFRKVWQSRYLRKPLRIWAAPVVEIKRVLLKQVYDRPDWATPQTLDALQGATNQEFTPGFSEYDGFIGLYAAAGVSRDTCIASRYHLDIRRPFRDLRLVDFILRIPAYQLYRAGVKKHILRLAMQGLLPDNILQRTQKTLYGPLYFSGVRRKKKFLQTTLNNPNAPWRQYVNADWVMRHWDQEIKPGQDGPGAVIPWLCLSFDQWYSSITGESSKTPERGPYVE